MYTLNNTATLNDTLDDTDIQTTFDELVEPIAVRVAKPRCADGHGTLTHDEHSSILDALRKGDADLAVKVSLEHVMESGRWLEIYRDLPAKLLREQEKQVTHLIKKSK